MEFSLKTDCTQPRGNQGHLCVIGKGVLDQRGDICDVTSIWKLDWKKDGPEEVEQIVSTVTKYRNERALNYVIGG